MTQASERARKSKTIEGQRLVGGPASQELFARLLGLDTTPEPYRVRKVLWMESHFEVSVGLEDDGTANVWIERRVPGGKSFLATDDLQVSYTGAKDPIVLVLLLKKFVPLRLARVTFDRLLEAFRNDPGVKDLIVPRTKGTGKRVANLLDTWGGEDSYADFFAGGEIARSQLDSLDPGKLFNFVQHCDAECLFVAPHGAAPMLSMVEYPWDERIRRQDEPMKPALGDGVSFASGDEDGMVTTDLSERDVLAGNPKKIQDVLEYVVQRPNPDRKLIFFSNTCVPTVTGEDVESIVKQYSARSDVPLVYLTVTPKSMTDVFRDLLVDRRLQSEARGVPADPRAVNLIGFPDNRGAKEVVDLLASFGVRVNSQILPDLQIDRLDRMAEAALNVFLPNGLWNHYYEQLQEDTRIPYIMPPAPYGVEGTRRWVEAVLKGLGLEAGFDAAWAATFAPHEAAWAALRERCGRHRLGFVIRNEEVHYLTDPGQTWGIPLIEATQEAGFGLDVLLRVTDRATARDKAARIEGLFAQPNTHTLVGFNTFEMMRERLKASACDAVLTHHFFDWRLSEAGKNRFSLQHFELGLPGTFRTMERLVRICETPFYRKYGRFLARTREGLRPRPGRAT